MITPEELQEIERLDREATPGPWEATEGDVNTTANEETSDEFAVLMGGIDADARFTARARTLLPRLAAAFAEQTATIAALAAGIEAADLRALRAEEALAKAEGRAAK